MIAHALLWLKNRPISLLLVSLSVVVPLMVISCGGGNNTMQTPNTGTINVSLSDPPGCKPPTGHLTHVFITVQSVKVHTSADRKSTRLNSSHLKLSRMPSSA